MGGRYVGLWGRGVCVCVCVTPKSFKSRSNCEVQQLYRTTMRPNHVCVGGGGCHIKEEDLHGSTGRMLKKTGRGARR